MIIATNFIGLCKIFRNGITINIKDHKQDIIFKPTINVPKSDLESREIKNFLSRIVEIMSKNSRGKA